MTTIRAIETPDIPQLAKIYADSFRSMHPQERWSTESAARFLTTCFQRQPDLAFLATMDEEIVGGFLAAIRPWWDGNHLVDGELFVSPTKQRQGIGASLMRILLTTAKERYQAVVMEAITFRTEEFPLSWYQKVGFHIVDDMVIISGKIDGLRF